jgi:hypothetical protein
MARLTHRRKIASRRPRPQPRKARRSIGVPWLEGGRLWLLSRPRPQLRDPVELARLLFADHPGDRTAWADALGTREVIPLDAARLASWTHALTELDGNPRLAALLAEGVRPLRRYRDGDLPGRIAEARRSLARLRVLLPALSAADACNREDGEPTPDELVAALPLRLFALGTWETDPVAALLRPTIAADEPLLRLAATAEDTELTALTGLLLGVRARARDCGRIERASPPRRRPARDSLTRRCRHASGASPCPAAPHCPTWKASRRMTSFCWAMRSSG